MVVSSKHRAFGLLLAPTIMTLFVGLVILFRIQLEMKNNNERHGFKGLIRFCFLLSGGGGFSYER